MSKRGRSASVIGAPKAAPALPQNLLDQPGAVAPDAPVAQPAQQPEDLNTPDTAASPTAVTMYDAQGQPVAVEAHKVKEAYDSGQLGFAQGQTIHVRDKSGKVFEATPDKIDAAFGSGYQAASPQEVADAIERKEYSGFGKGAQAFGAGVGRGLTFGLSDVAASAIGGDATREHLEKLQKYHPIASTTGEITGAAAPVLLSGGIGAAAEAPEVAAEGTNLATRTIGAIGAMPRAVATLGGLAEEGASKLVGEGATSFLGRAAQRAIPLAAQGATEGAFYGAGQEISESALGNHELNAEKLLAAAGHGALLGAVGGGIIGAGEVTAKAALDKGLALAGKGDLETWLKDIADRQTGKALGVSAADYKNLAGVSRTAESAETRMSEIADTVRNYKFDNGEKLFTPTSTTAKLADKLPEAADEVGEKLGAFREKVAAIAEKNPELAPNMGDFFKKFDAQVMAPAAESPTLAGRALKAENEIASLREKFNQAVEGLKPPPSIEDLQTTKEQLDKILFPKRVGGIAPPPPEHMEQLFTARQLLEQEIESTTDRVVASTGDAAMEGQYKALKSTYRDLTQARQMAQAADLRAAARNTASLSDKMAFGSTFTGMMAGGAGGPAAIGGSLLAGAANAAANKYGNAMIASAADRMAQLMAVRRATMQVDHQINRGVDAFLSGEVQAVHVHGPEEEWFRVAHAESSKAVGERIGERVGQKAEAKREAGNHFAGPLSYLGAAPNEAREVAVEGKRQQVATPAAKHLEKAANFVAPIAGAAPQTAGAVAQKSQTIMGNLQAKMPQKQLQTSSLQPTFDRPRISASDQAKFARYASAVEKPLTVLDQLKDGTLSREGVQAVKDNYPELFKQIQQTIMEKVGSAKTELPYEKRILLGTLFGVPTDGTLDPKFKASISSMYDETASQPKNQGGSGGGKQGARRPAKNLPGSVSLPAQQLQSEAA